jgi:wyosine [tRNA(Phe)-imidazoG37] synthetase (radical SAM superfamily)
LLRDAPGVQIALSLHAPTQDLRLKIVPTAKSWPLDKLIETVDEINEKGHKVMIEYIAIGNLNTSPEIAHLLGKLLQGKKVMVNFIPYNPTNVAECFSPPTHEEVIELERIVRDEYGIITAIRRTMGQDINGACGQLVINNTQCQEGNSLLDIEDLGSSDLKKRSSRMKVKSTQEKSPANLTLPYWTLLVPVAILLFMMFSSKLFSSSIF